MDPDGRASKVASLIRLGATGAKEIGRLTMEQAQRARRAGQNVHGDTRQVAAKVEKGAFGNSRKNNNILKHDGHILQDGSKGMPHFQTEGQFGHTFWGGISTAFTSLAVGLDYLANTAEVVDPMTYITSGDNYIDPNGNVVSYGELMQQIHSNKDKKSSKKDIDK